MLLIDLILYVIWALLKLSCFVAKCFIPKWILGKKIDGKKTKRAKKLSVFRSEPKVGGGHKKCEGCNNSPIKEPTPESPSRFNSSRKMSRRDLENAGFTKPTLSSLMKKNRRSESPEPFQKTLRSYKRYSSTNSVSSYTTTVSTSSGVGKINQSSSNESVSKSPIKLCYGVIGELEGMNEVVDYLPPVETCVATCTDVTEVLQVATCSSVEVFTAETVKQYESDDSQIFSDESPDEAIGSATESVGEVVSEDSQVFSVDSLEDQDETDRQNDSSREESVRQRIENGLSKIDRLAEEMRADEDPFYQRLFSNLRKVTVFLCETTDDWELGKSRENSPEKSDE